MPEEIRILQMNLNGGGKLQVPCLKIDGDKIRWMYESKDIIIFLNSYLELINGK